MNKMFKQYKFLKSSICVISFLLLTACGNDDAAKNSEKPVEKTVSAETSAPTKEELAKQKETISKAEEIGWEKLIPADYDPNEAVGEYIEELNKLNDDDQEAIVLYGKIQAELDNAPVNTEMDGKTIKMPGFIAPLENENGVINEFLLVPYFGACIHSPPPPMNQTVMIKADKGQGVKSEDANYPVWITGKLKAIEERTEIGAAGYTIENAVVEPYEDEIPRY